METLFAATAIFCLGSGIAVLWATPGRFTNQVFSLTSVLAACWVGSVSAAMLAGASAPMDGGLSQFWIRVNGAMAAFLTWSLCLLKDSVISGSRTRSQIILRLLPLFVVGLTSAALCFTDWYHSLDSSPLTPKRGPAYYGLGALACGMQIYVVIDTWHKMGRQSGIRRVESQFLILNLGVALLVVTAGTMLGNFLHLQWVRRGSFFIFCGSYALAAWAITFHRVYTPAQILLSLGQRVTLIAGAAAGMIAGWRMLQGNIPYPADFLLSIGICLSLALWLDRKSRGWLRLDDEHALGRLRNATITIARTEPNPGHLITAFQHLLRTKYGTSSAHLMFPPEDHRTGESCILRNDRPAYAAVCSLTWATPESLERQRPSPGTSDLRVFLSEHGFGVIVAAPRGSAIPTLMIGLAAKDGGWPFTYPEVQRLQSVAELMDNIMTRSRLMTQAAVRAKMEHLALMSRGMAHDLKNLLTPVSSFLVHTAGRFDAGSAEEEVHAAAKKSVSTIADYLREALFFANKLTPQFTPASLGEIGRTVQELTATRAARRGITLYLQIDDIRVIADAILVQRLLVNLINNAVDAETAGGTVRVRSQALRTGWISLQVIDQGSGIADEHLARVFEPYFTTKEFGDQVRGFGLGLTICQKIVQLHHGSIRIESKLGAGTTVTVELPVTQPETRSSELVLATQ